MWIGDRDRATEAETYFEVGKRHPLPCLAMRRCVVVCSLALLACVAGSKAESADNDWLQSIRAANRSSIVFISVKVQSEGEATVTTTGTGFIIHPEGWLITCDHVVPKKTKSDKVTINLTVGDRQEMSYLNEAIRHDEDEDLALLKLPAREGNPWHVVKSVGDAELESEIAAFGFPLTEGLVGKSGRIANKNGENGKWITDAPVNPGMSGGPVFDKTGVVVAVVQGGYEEAQNLNLVVPVSFAKGLLQKVNSPLLVGSNILPTPIKIAEPVVYSETVATSPGEEFEYSIKATGSPTKYSAAGLPEGLTLDRESGDISGVVDEEGKAFKVDIRAQNKSGWGKGHLLIRMKGRKTQEQVVTSTAEPWSNLSRFVFQNGVFSVQGGNVYAPNGAFIGYLTGPNIQGAVATLAWTNGTASHFMANGAIVNLYPTSSMVVGNWR